MKTERGFSLVSVLVAIVLLSVGILALSRTGGEVMRSTAMTGMRTTALAIARGHLEWVRSQNPRELASETAVKVDEEGRPAAAGPFERWVDVTDRSRNLKEIVVYVNYPRAPRPIRLVTLSYVGAY